MAENPEDTLPELPKPTVEEADMKSVPGAIEGTEVEVCRIDPQSGQIISRESGLSGEVTGWKTYLPGICCGAPLSVYTAMHKEAFARDPDRRITPAHTSVITRIDRMSDGSYWITTMRSVYRVEVVGQPPELDQDTISEIDPSLLEADAEEGQSRAGSERLENRRRADRVLRDEEGAEQ